jgi:hypothetical protein
MGVGPGGSWSTCMIGIHVYILYAFICILCVCIHMITNICVYVLYIHTGCNSEPPKDVAHLQFKLGIYIHLYIRIYYIYIYICIFIYIYIYRYIYINECMYICTSRL